MGIQQLALGVGSGVNVTFGGFLFLSYQPFYLVSNYRNKYAAVIQRHKSALSKYQDTACTQV